MSPVKRIKKSTKITAKSGKVILRTAPGVAPNLVYFNRELSTLAFNRRVLDQATIATNPLLERVKFLAILCSNLDEFFEIRVAGLMQQVDAQTTEPSLDGLSAREQLKRILASVNSLVKDQYQCWREQLMPALAKEGVVINTATELTESQRAWARKFFSDHVQPVLTPLAIDQLHPFPQIGNKTLNVLVALANPETPDQDALIAILPVPNILPRIVLLEPGQTGPQHYIFLSEIIKLFAGELFPGYRVNGAHAFRVTRNSDLYIDEEEVENLLKRIEEELRNLRRGASVRLEIEAGVDETLFEVLIGHLNQPRECVFRLDGPLNLLRLNSLYDVVDRPDLKYVPFAPVELPSLSDPAKIFDRIRERDILLQHPYESFTPVVDFIEQAAIDPEVYAIKQTLYRTSGDSPIIRALIDASRNGKQVTALIELKARFDEANNIKWAKELEEAGVHVVYGLVGHKTHCKCSLVVRREGEGLRRYAHLGTGNYNPRTARLYTDFSLLTCRENLTVEVAELFNTLTGFGRSPDFKLLLVAPFNLHSRLQELIAAEATNATAGKPARIMAKMNKLVDQVTIDNLYAASQAGVKIDLIVRGTCCLVPGVKGLSENIRIRNIVGRFLEHSRVYYFENAGQPLLYCGSADWMTRSFFRRVEVLYPIEDVDLRRRMIDDVFPAEFRDNTDACELRSNGDYERPAKVEGEAPFSVQKYFATAAAQRAAAQIEVATP